MSLARLATAAKLKQEMSSVRAKLPREVSTYLPLQLVLVGEGDGMDDEVEAAPTLFQRGKGGVDTGIVGHVAGHHDIGADRLWPAAVTRFSSASP